MQKYSVMTQMCQKLANVNFDTFTLWVSNYFLSIRILFVSLHFDAIMFGIGNVQIMQY